MSFDLKIEQNDLSINSDGSIKTVRNTEKLKQDILKISLTPLGSNPFHQWFGNTLTTRVIGKMLDASQIDTETKTALQEGISNIIALQQAQSKFQFVSPAEQIAAIKQIQVIRDQSDPRQFQIYILILTKLLTTVEETFTLRV